jgi:hypothetical protein
MESLDQHFQRFLRERIYLHGVTPNESGRYRDVAHRRVRSSSRSEHDLDFDLMRRDGRGELTTAASWLLSTRGPSMRIECDKRCRFSGRL